MLVDALVQLKSVSRENKVLQNVPQVFSLEAGRPLRLYILPQSADRNLDILLRSSSNTPFPAKMSLNLEESGDLMLSSNKTSHFL